MLSYEDALTATKCKRLEVSVRKWALLFAGFLCAWVTARFLSLWCQDRWWVGRREGGRDTRLAGRRALTGTSRYLDCVATGLHPPEMQLHGMI